MKLQISRSMFGVICLSAAIGLLLYWVMFMNVLPRILRPQASWVLPLISGIVGASCSALFYFAAINLMPSFKWKHKVGSGIVFVRCGDGVLVRTSGGKPIMIHRSFPVKPVLPAKPVRTQRSSKPSWIRALKTSVLVAAVMGGYFMITYAFGTFTPFIAVPSGSMSPTLNIGDLIFVKGVDAEQIHVGDIIVFNVPSPFDRTTPSPIVHRVVEILTENGAIYFRTKGDNESEMDPWIVPSGNVVGIVAGKMPMLGYVILYLRNIYVLASIIAVLAFWTLYPYLKRGGK
ncbi:signal peptidase I [Candidatus Bathyarchaeota archaeon]|nr:signal peptidase I [Candidatus Bathyarchaeota archaeon]